MRNEVERLTALLQLSERKRHNQKIVYDRNLENLHDKLADFESVLAKEQKEVELMLKKKDQQLKMREELTETLKSQLDSRYCSHCGFPNSSRNTFDTDWEMDVSKQSVHKLPALSLPSPDNLPQVTFASRPSHFKSKLSPVVEECEVASSSYLRNIHADQTPDRFHAVLTASLECLQAVDYTEKNITPESENYDEQGVDLMHQRRSSLDDDSSLDDVRVRNLPYSCPRPSFVEPPSFCGRAVEDVAELNENSPMSRFASGIAASVLEKSFTKVTSAQQHTTSDAQYEDAGSPVTLSDVHSFSECLASDILGTLGPAVIHSYSKNLACGIMDDMHSNSFLTLLKQNLTDVNNIDDESHDSVSEIEHSSLDSSTDMKTSSLSDNSDDKISVDCVDRCGDVSTLPADTPQMNYTGVCSVVMPLIDEAILQAKNHVRRRSSTTRFSPIDTTTQQRTGDDDPNFLLKRTSTGA